MSLLRSLYIVGRNSFGSLRCFICTEDVSYLVYYSQPLEDANSSVPCFSSPHYLVDGLYKNSIVHEEHLLIHFCMFIT